MSKVEKVRVSVPVDVDVRISEDVFEEALRKSEFYFRVVKPRLDLAKFLESHMKDPEEFYLWFYTNEPTLKQVFEKIKEGSQ